MDSIRSLARLTPALVSIALVILLHASPAAAQPAPDLYATFLPLPPGATGSEARKISVRGWDPLTVAGAVDAPNQKASCWIRVANTWSAHVLPGLTATGESWANGVDHVRVATGEWTLVVGAAMDAAGVQQPMRWDNVTNQPWTGQPLPTPPGGSGEALSVFLLFKPDGTPLRARACGWVSEAAPTALASESNPKATHLRLPVLWNIDQTGAEIIYPQFGPGLEGVVNDVASSPAGVFMSAGGGQNSAGQWKPQLWKSLDGGQTWLNEEMPLPLGVETGEATDWDHEVGHWQGAGYGVSQVGKTVPLLWELYTGPPITQWIVHELPLPPLDEGGVNGAVHKVVGRTKYANIVLKQGVVPELGIWVDNPAGGWDLLGPNDYMVNPEFGTPVAHGGIDKYGRVAVKFPNPPLAATPNAPGDLFSLAGLLTPSPETGVENAAPRLIALSSSPNPFNAGVRIGYTVPWDASVNVMIHDVTGRVVARLDRGRLHAGEERVVHWDGTGRDGRRVASGVYFVRVETPFGISTLKMVRVD